MKEQLHYYCGFIIGLLVMAQITDCMPQWWTFECIGCFVILMVCLAVYELYNDTCTRWEIKRIKKDKS